MKPAIHSHALRIITLLLSLSSLSFTSGATPLDQLLENNASEAQFSEAAQPLASSIAEESDEISLDELGTEEEFLPVEEAYQLSIAGTSKGLSLDWVIADEYFLYGEQFRFSVNNKPVNATLPVGIIKYDPIFEKDVEKHYHHAKVIIDQAELPQNPGYELTVVSQGCADAGLCYPPQTQRFTVNNDSVIPVVEPESQFTPLSNSAQEQPQQSAALAKVISMICFAIIGGMILNLMPCVLPVLSLKALSLANSESNHRHQGWSYTLGAISTFTLIAGLLLAVRAAGQAVGWGFQLQSPGFVTVLVYLFFIMGLALSGHITIGTRWMSAGQGLTQGNGLKQSYFTGVLAAVVASPCTAPFMAPALGFAITQPWWIALTIFASLGFGMALPLLLLSYAPQLNKWLPKPGAWMETFKQALAFPLYLTAIWLLWVLSRQLGPNTTALVILGGLVIVFIFWLGERVKPVLSIASILTLILVAGISWSNSKQPLATKAVASSSEWETYSPQRLDELRQQGKAVFINMTADWCITCIANEKVAFTDTILETMRNKGIHLVKGDWTNYDPEITQLLEKHKRGGVPLYLLYPAKAGEEAEVLPQILSPGYFKEKIEAI